MRAHKLLRCLLPLALTVLSGCGAGRLSDAVSSHSAGVAGRLVGGQQPIAGATVQLWEAGTTGDGSSSTALIGNTVTSDAGGNFNITGLYVCDAPDSLVYLTATGGNPGLAPGTTNAASVIMAALGTCDQLSASSFIVATEVTTVAAVASLAPFMKSVAAVGSSSQDLSSFQSAFATASQLANVANGTSPGINVPTGYTVPVATIYTLADIVSACVNSSGGVAGDGSICGQLFTLATPAGGTVPTTVVAALLNLANNPSLNTTALFNLTPTIAPFQPTLSTAPPDFSIRILRPTTLQLAPTTVSFPGTAVGNSASPQTVTLTNTGNTKITISGIAITGANAGDFSQTNNCPAALLPQGSCTVNVTWTPLATGSRNAYVMVSSNAANPTQSVALAGVASPSVGALSPSPASLTFPSTPVGSADPVQTVILTNTGTGSLVLKSFTLSGANTADFAISNNCPATLAPSAVCTVTVTFTPTATGSRSATLNVVSTASNSTFSIGLTGTAAAGVATGVTLSATQLTLSDYVAPLSQTVTVTYTGAVNLLISAVNITDGFTQTNNCGSILAPQSVCTITVSPVVSPWVATTGTLTLVDNDTVDPQTVTLTNETFWFTYGNWPVGTQSLNTIDVQNWTLVLIRDYASRSALDGQNPGDFLFTSAAYCNQQAFTTPTIPCTYAAFKPTTTGTRLAFVENLDPMLQSVKGKQAMLYGVGAAPGAPAAALLQASLTAQEYSTFNSNLSLYNSGGTTLQIAGVSAFSTNSANMSVTSTTCGTLAPQASCTANLAFTAQAYSQRQPPVIVSVTDSISGQQFSTLQYATVTPQPISASVSSLTFPPTHYNTSSAPQTFTIANPDAHLVKFSFSSPTSGPNDFIAAPATCSTVSCTISITYRPQDAAAYNILALVDTTTQQQISVYLYGTPGLSNLVIAPTTLNFSSRPVGSTSIAQTISLTNTGDGPANFTVTAPSGPSVGTTGSDFLFPASASYSISSGGSAGLSYSFAPTGSGVRNATVTLTDTTSGAVTTLYLNGTGQ